MKMIIASLVLVLTSLGLSAQDSHEHKHEDKTATVDSTYSCTKHPEVKSEKDGNCPKCSAKLVKGHSHAEKSKEGYSCSMHPDKKSDKPGKCPTCGMKLVESREPEQNKGGRMGTEH